LGRRKGTGDARETQKRKRATPESRNKKSAGKVVPAKRVTVSQRFRRVIDGEKPVSLKNIHAPSDPIEQRRFTHKR